MRALIRLLFSVLFITSIATCGQQGPLYLPNEDPPSTHLFTKQSRPVISVGEQTN